MGYNLAVYILLWKEAVIVVMLISGLERGRLVKISEFIKKSGTVQKATLRLQGNQNLPRD